MGLQAGDTVHLVCLGNIPGPTFLDGRTGDGSVGLAPSTDDPFTGTRWRAVDDGAGHVELRCLGDVDGPRLLDGRTTDGSAGLAPNAEEPFSGTHWQVVPLNGDAFALQCLGDLDGPRMLDGRTGDGSVGLAPETGDQFTGTHWRADPIGLPSQLDFDFPSITFPTGFAVGGAAHLTITSDGGYTFRGHYHDSGAAEYNISSVLAVKDTAGLAYTFTHDSHVAGTFESGSRDDDWSDNGTDPRLRDHWSDLALGARAELRAEVDTDLANVVNLVIGVLGTVLGVISIV